VEDRGDWKDGEIGGKVVCFGSFSFAFERQELAGKVGLGGEEGEDQPEVRSWVLSVRMAEWWLMFV